MSPHLNRPSEHTADVSPYAVCEGVVGARSRVGPGAYIGPGVTVGDDCVIEPGAVIGSNGFGYTRDGKADHEARNASGPWQLKEQHHGVVIGNDVHIGANACIDRGSYRDTVIGDGTKIDNLVHIAHNVIVGRDCLIIAHAMLAGSVTVDDGAWIAPHAIVREHLHIGAKAFVALGAVVTKDVSDGASVRGVPAKVFQPREAEATVGASGRDVAA